MRMIKARSTTCCRVGMTLAAFASLGGCERRPDRGPVVVSVIGTQPKFDATIADTGPERVLTGAIAEGLVRFDGAGQIEPGLAERWIVIDGGLRYIFRLRSGQWSDGRAITTAQVVTVLNRRLKDPNNPLAPYLTAIDEVVEMTPQVIEIRLSRPRPDLLQLFAQPELAIARLRPPGGSGPFRVVSGSGLLLRPVPDPNRADDEAEGADAAPEPERDVRLIGERTARAVARFVNKQSDLVLGGTFVDWPLTIVGRIPPANLRVDPAAGLFGLAVVRREGLLATPAGRAAVAGAIDRAAIVASFAPALAPVENLLPDRLDSAVTPVQPIWSALSPAERRNNAIQAVTAARPAGGEAPTLRIALPEGPGSAILFRRLRFALSRVGIESERVKLDSPAVDLRLVDRVAPYDSARWYLRTACQPCSAQAEAAVEAARTAPTLSERGRAIAEADAALASDVAFIPLMRPLRWSAVAQRLARFQGNPRAWHPLHHLRNETD